MSLGDDVETQVNAIATAAAALAALGDASPVTATSGKIHRSIVYADHVRLWADVEAGRTPLVGLRTDQISGFLGDGTSSVAVLDSANETVIVARVRK